MLDMQKLVDSMNEQDRKTRSQYHLTLGGLIGALDRALLKNEDSYCVIDKGGGTLGKEMSYRGYYSDLSFDREHGRMRKNVDVLAQCRKAVGNVYEGYKGGDFRMELDTPLWVAEYGETGVAMVDVDIDTDGDLMIITKQVD